MNTDKQIRKEGHMNRRYLNEAIDISQKRMLSEKEAQVYLGIGRTKCRNFCQSIGAILHIGSRILYDKKVIDTYLNDYNNQTVAGKEAT